MGTQLPQTVTFERAFFEGSTPLRGDNAVAAILVRNDGRYVMQLRDTHPHIFYPGHWGCFGGAVNAGEDPVEALRRELFEELELSISDVSEFTRFDFDFRRFGPRQNSVYRIYYSVMITIEQYDCMVLHEGTQFGAFEGRALLRDMRVTPYDAFAIWLHMSRARFGVHHAVPRG